ncbi:hypothetical protein Tco_0525900 [Tanacetum coccineum]
MYSQLDRKYGVGLKHGNEIVYQHLKYWLGPDMATEVKRYGASSKLDFFWVKGYPGRKISLFASFCETCSLSCCRIRAVIASQDCLEGEYYVHCHIQFHLAQTNEQQYCDTLLDGWIMSQCPRAIQELKALTTRSLNQ